MGSNNKITKKTMLPLGLVIGIVAGIVSIFLWADAEHDSIADTLRIERQIQYGELKEDIKEVKSDIKEVNAKIDGLKDLLIQMSGGTP